MRTARRAVAAALLATSLSLALASGAWGAIEPISVFIPSPSMTPALPGGGYLDGPCGVNVDGSGAIYVSDYYHHAVDIFMPDPKYSGKQLENEDPSDGPCGLAIDASNHVYVNNYHRNVVKFNPLPSFGPGSVFPLPEEETAHHLPTGVSVGPEGNVYVDNRTFVSVFEPSGAPLEEGGQPVRIGLGTLGDGYGIAVSSYSGTYGRVYVPDASSNTVKVYDPAVNKGSPIAEIKDPFGHPFVSLHDSAIAVDKENGVIYFADELQTEHTERPQAEIYAYSAVNTYNGHLKYNVTDAQQPGIAVDNSGLVTQSRVYVTSGNTTQAGIYIYGPSSWTTGPLQPPTFTVSVSSIGSGSGSVGSAAAKLDCSNACERQLLAGGEATFSASPDPGSRFAGWSGACEGSAPTCTVTLDEATSVRARFREEEPQGTLVEQAAPQPALAAAPQPGPRRHRRHRRSRHRRHGHGHRYRQIEHLHTTGE